MLPVNPRTVPDPLSNYYGRAGLKDTTPGLPVQSLRELGPLTSASYVTNDDGSLRFNFVDLHQRQNITYRNGNNHLLIYQMCGILWGDYDR